jgi:hypothetical protein
VKKILRLRFETRMAELNWKVVPTETGRLLNFLKIMENRCRSNADTTTSATLIKLAKVHWVATAEELVSVCSLSAFRTCT